MSHIHTAPRLTPASRLACALLQLCVQTKMKTHRTPGVVVVSTEVNTFFGKSWESPVSVSISSRGTCFPSCRASGGPGWGLTLSLARHCPCPLHMATAKLLADAVHLGGLCYVQGVGFPLPQTTGPSVGSGWRSLSSPDLGGRRRAP